MTVAKNVVKNTIEVKRDKAAMTSQFAFEDEAKRIAKLAEKTARLKALREAQRA